MLNFTKCTNWATYVRNLLCSLCLNYLCENQWLLIICQRLLDQTKQELNLLLDASSKCILYKYIVSNIDLQFYLQKHIPAMFRKCIAKIRLLSHNIFIETGRYTGIDRKCILCNLNVLEDEFHFVLQCTMYNDLRKKYIMKYFWSRPSTFKLVQLLSVENGKELCNLGKFIHLTCKARNNLV